MVKQTVQNIRHSLCHRHFYVIKNIEICYFLVSELNEIFQNAGVVTTLITLSIRLTKKYTCTYRSCKEQM